MNPRYSALLAVLLLGTGSACVSSRTMACADGTRCPEGMVCSVAFGPTSVCVPQGGCGDGMLDEGEVCDDGNVISGDGCSADCRTLERCGNSIIDRGEICDDGNRVPGDGCSMDCTSMEICGNGAVDRAVGEVCDDGNRTSGDGCSADCMVLESCGNRFLDEGEVCDDGNRESGDGCSTDCMSSEICGNGIVDVGEQCDPGLPGDTSGSTGTSWPAATVDCDPDCTRPVCGDGILNVAAGEQCDDSNDITDDSCPSGPEGTCQLPICGDGFIYSEYETCDDGDERLNDGCPSGPDGTCRLAYCGDGFVNQRDPNFQQREQCDVANNLADGTNLDCLNGLNRYCVSCLCTSGL